MNRLLNKMPKRKLGLLNGWIYYPGLIKRRPLYIHTYLYMTLYSRYLTNLWPNVNATDTDFHIQSVHDLMDFLRCLLNLVY